MEAIGGLVQRLRYQITAVETVLSDLKSQLAKAEQEAGQRTKSTQSNGQSYTSCIDPIEEVMGSEHVVRTWMLEPEEYKRYGRQLIMPEVGIKGQLALKKASVLVVGLGGLGCPAAAYLAGAGVGRIGLVDGDTIELSNLHRQILHDQSGLGKKKVKSAAERLKALNSNIKITTYTHHLTSLTAVGMMSQYDIILDCTDRPSTRYLVSDAAVLAGKSVVTASALRTEGQLIVLNDSRSQEQQHKFCYRCVFPKPPPAESVMTCGEGGILGPVVGVMGVLMAMECLKIILHGKPLEKHTATEKSAKVNGSQRHATPENDGERPSLLLYSAFSSPTFRSVRLRGQRKGCISCSDESKIFRETLESGFLDYEEFCGVSNPVDILSDADRLSPAAYHKLRESRADPYILVDVREKVQSDICPLPTSINIPYTEFSSNPIGSIHSIRETIDAEDTNIAEVTSLYFICRFGNDSQLAVHRVKELAQHREDCRFKSVVDIKGGLRAWRQQVDPEFPEY